MTAYAGAIPKFDNRDLSQAAASILSDEAMHWAVLRQVLGLDPVPEMVAAPRDNPYIFFQADGNGNAAEGEEVPAQATAKETK